MVCVHVLRNLVKCRFLNLIPQRFTAQVRGSRNVHSNKGLRAFGCRVSRAWVPEMPFASPAPETTDNI